MAEVGSDGDVDVYEGANITDIVTEEAIVHVEDINTKNLDVVEDINDVDGSIDEYVHSAIVFTNNTRKAESIT